MKKRILTTAVAAGVLATLAFADGERVPVEPFLGTLGDSQTLTSGEDIYTYWCAACHAIGKPGSIAVMMLHGEQAPRDLADNDNLTTDYVSYLVRNGQSAMPHFRQTQISDAQLEALAEYLAGENE